MADERRGWKVDVHLLLDQSESTSSSRRTRRYTVTNKHSQTPHGLQCAGYAFLSWNTPIQPPRSLQWLVPCPRSTFLSHHGHPPLPQTLLVLASKKVSPATTTPTICLHIDQQTKWRPHRHPTLPPLHRRRRAMPAPLTFDQPQWPNPPSLSQYESHSFTESN